MTKKWMSRAPKGCDICNREFIETDGWYLNDDWFVDGRTKFGPWAIICKQCFPFVGTGLGLGKGQKYDLDTLEKIEG